ncbi:MAG: helix-turn-helix domain-containing protein [Streptosporangiales bacterium]|nr:helix-turn-helix domain-containing protein [Streptosporangiales bacterium]
MQNVINCFRVLEAVAEHQPVGVSELARLLGMPRTSVFRCLQTLQQAEWLAPLGHDDTRWRVTARALTIARASPERGLREAALPVLQRLRDETDETVYLTVRDGYGAVLVERLDSNRSVRTFYPLYGRMPLHGPSNAKAILAHLSEEEIDEVMTAGLDRYTDTTQCQPDALRADITATRERGYSINLAEWRPEVCGIGAAILDPTMRPVGGTSISMPAFRFDEDDIARYGSLVAAAAAEIAHRLYSV